MAGIASLIGGNSAKTDRNQQLADQSGLINLSNYAQGQGEPQQTSGQGLVGQAGDYFSRLLRSGRTETMQNAAPAINNTLSAADAERRREALTGTGRTGGTVEADRNAGSATDSNIANIVNNTTQQEKATGAQGSLAAGSTQLQNSLAMLGLSEDAIKAVMKNSTDSRATSQDIHNGAYQGVASDIGHILTLPTAAPFGVGTIGSKIASFL